VHKEKHCRHRDLHNETTDGSASMMEDLCFCTWHRHTVTISIAGEEQSSSFVADGPRRKFSQLCGVHESMRPSRHKQKKNRICGVNRVCGITAMVIVLSSI
jgi:hypothetical protein